MEAQTVQEQYSGSYEIDEVAELFPLTLYTTITVSDRNDGASTSKLCDKEKVLTVSGENDLLYFLRISQNEDSNPLRTVISLVDRSNNVLLEMFTDDGFTNSQCVCGGCQYYRKQHQQNQPKQTLTASTKYGNLCFVELRHDVLTVLDAAKIVSLCVMPAKAHQGVHMISYRDHGKRKIIGSLRRDDLGFSIEPLGSTSAKDMSIMLALGAGAFLLPMECPAPSKYAPGSHRERSVANARRPNSDRLDSCVKCCCCSSRGEQHNACYVATDLCLRILCLSSSEC